jgi:hypothetical protein
MRLLTLCSGFAALALTACGVDESASWEPGSEEWGYGSDALAVIGVAVPNVAAPSRAGCGPDKQGRGCDQTATIAPVVGVTLPASPVVVGDSSPDPIPAINPDRTVDRTADDRTRPARGDCDRSDVSAGRKGCTSKPGRNAP